MSYRYGPSRKRYLFHQSLDPEVIQDYEKFIENSDPQTDLEERQKMIKLSKMGSRRKQKLINLERQAMWDNQFFQTTLPVRQLVMIKPEPPKSKKKKQYLQDYRRDVTDDQKPWYLFNSQEQQRKDFNTRVIRRNHKYNFDHQSELPDPDFMVKTVDIDERNPMSDAKMKNQYYVWSHNKKNKSKEVRPKRNYKANHSMNNSKKQLGSANEKIESSKQGKYFSSQQNRRILGPAHVETVKNSDIETLTVQNTNLETIPRKRDFSHNKIESQSITFNFRPKVKTPPKQSVIKIVERKQLYSRIIQTFSVNYVPPEKSQKSKQQATPLQTRQMFTQTKFAKKKSSPPAQQPKKQPLQQQKSQPIQQQTDLIQQQNLSKKLSSPQKQQQKDNIFQQIQNTNTKKVKPVYQQLLTTIIQNNTSPSALDIIKADMIQMQKNKTIDQELELEIEEREALIDQMRELLGKGDDNQENAVILVSLIKQYREATLDVVRELKEWDQQNQEQYVWEQQIYVNKIGNDLVFWGQDLKEDEFDPFLVGWGDEEDIDPELRVKIKEGEQYIQKKQEKYKLNPET